MNRILGALKATYNFFSGDAIVISIVAVAFIAAYVLERVSSGNQWPAATLFVVLILLSITVSLGRERASTLAKHTAERRAG